MASAALAAILQVVLRTAMMAAASTFLCRYRITLFPTVALLVFVSYRVYAATRSSAAKGFKSLPVREMSSPLISALGMIFMYWGRYGGAEVWSRTFWMGECVLMTTFLNNSVPENAPRQTPYSILAGFVVLSFFLSLILRGKFWRYLTLIGLESSLAFLTLTIFPMMEMVLEEMVNEKMRKIGAKVRINAEMSERRWRARVKAARTE